MALRTPLSLVSSQEKFEEYVQKLSRMDLFDLAPPYSKALFAKGLTMFRSGHAGIHASIQKIDSAIEMKFSHQDKVENSMSIRPTQGRIPVFEGFACGCAQFAEVGQCEHLISSHLLLWGSSQDESSIKKKYGFCPENEKNIQDFRRIILTFRNQLAERPQTTTTPENVSMTEGAPALSFTTYTAGPLKGCLRLSAEPNALDGLEVDPQLLSKAGLRHRPTLTEDRREFFRTYSPQKLFDHPHLETAQFDFFIAYDHFLRRHSAEDGALFPLVLPGEAPLEVRELKYLSHEPQRRVSTGQLDWSCEVKTQPSPAIRLQIKNAESEDIFWGPNWIFEKSQGRLWMHPLWILQSLFQYQDAPFVRGTTNDVSFPNGSALSEWFMTALNRIEKSVDSLKFSNALETLPADSIQMDCDIAEPIFQLRFRREASPLSIPWFKPAMELTQLTAQGFSSLHEIQKLLPEHTARTVLRSLDQKLLHHKGLSLLYQTHVLDGIIGEPEWFKNFCAAGGPLLQPTSKLTKKVYRLSDLLSDRVLIALESAGQRLIQDLKSDFYLFADDKTCRIQGLGQKFGLFWRVLLAHVGASAQASDDTIRFHEPLLQPAGEPYSFELNAVGAMSAWSLLKWAEFADDARTQLTYQNQRIFRAEPSKFKAHFNVEEAKFSGDTSNTRAPMDWFELDSKFFLDGQELTHEQSESFLKDGLIRIDERVFVLSKTDETVRESLKFLWDNPHLSPFKQDEKKSDKPKKWTFQRSQILELLALRSRGIEVTGGPTWKRVCEFYDSLSKGRQEIAPSSQFKGELKAYQSIGLNWLRDLYELRLGAILADDMGLGKTIQTLGFFDFLHSQKELGNCLVVVPSTLIINWSKEMERFVPHIPRTVLSGKLLGEGLDEATRASLGGTSTVGGRVFVCSYNFLSEKSEWIQAQKWNLMVFDEAQSLKNLSSQRTQSARTVKSRFRLCLTGTPLENHIGEAFSIIDLSLPGALGTWADFRKKYFVNQGISLAQAQGLRLRMKPILLRRTKSEILSELPQKTEIVVPVPFSDVQKSIYKNIALQWNSKVRESIQAAGESQSQLLMITALLRLRQACSDPAGLPEVSYDELPPKIEMLGDSIQDIVEAGESALVFTQFISTFDRVLNHLTQRGIPTFGLQGSMNQKQREKALNGFQEMEQGAVMVATLKTGGVGLNLTKASYVFHLDPWWNPAVENQATDRTHRIGQTKPVTVYRYIMQGSIEEKIEVLKERKRMDFQALFGDQETPHAGNLAKDRLTQEDFDYLLKEDIEV